jgi:predicted nucleotide-binding protein (sugar kinase/HSP70/actin superfamily)
MNNLINHIMPARRAAQQNLTIGIPRALTYYEYGKLWENFFTLLGFSVVVSQTTNRRILDLGVNCCSNETCLPVKVMAGHVLSLAGKADVIFIPRYVSTDLNEITCPKICSLPDIINLCIKARTDVVELTLDLKNGLKKTDETLTPLADRLGMDEKTVRSAFLKAVGNRMRSDMETASLEVSSTRPSVALLGHPYMINDAFLSMDLALKLHRRGYDVHKPLELDRATSRANAYPYAGRQFYGVGLDNLGGAFTYARLPGLRGIIYLSPFACGVDSLVTEFIERHLKAIGSEVPYMKLTVDEHTGEAGFDTRLEAFLDMLESEAIT